MDIPNPAAVARQHFRIHELTDEYKRERDAAQARFEEIRRRLEARGYQNTTLELRLSPHGLMEAYFRVNSTGHNWPYQRYSLDKAMCYTQDWGMGGYWSLDQLEEWVDNPMGSHLGALSMWGYGFRPHRTQPGRWARRASHKSKDGEPRPRQALWPPRLELLTRDFEERYGGICQRLTPENRFGYTYHGLQVQPDGKLLVAPSHWRLEPEYPIGVHLASYFHLAPQQEGYRLQSRSLSIDDVDPDAPEYEPTTWVLIQVARGESPWVPIVVLPRHLPGSLLASALERMAACLNVGADAQRLGLSC
jgi:hypothetical protein